MSGVLLPEKFRRLQVWIDSYTMVLESTADARSDTRLNRAVNDSVRQLERQARKTGAVNDVQAAANQRMIQRQMGWSKEDHAELKRLWKCASSELMARSWDLSEEINFGEDPDKRIRFWQGEDPRQNCFVISRAEGSLLIKFLRFVESNSSGQYDPREHVRKTLLAQGINKRNFHEYADRLAVTNPWLDT